MVTGEQEGDSHLAAVLFAELPAVLPGDADRMRAFLSNAGVIDHSTADGASLLEDRQNMGAHSGQQGIIGPVGLGDEMVQRLVGRLDATGFDRAAIGSTLLRAPGSSRPVQ